jgi:hypothetical protein
MLTIPNYLNNQILETYMSGYTMIAFSDLLCGLRNSVHIPKGKVASNKYDDLRDHLFSDVSLLPPVSIDQSQPHPHHRKQITCPS